MGGDPGCSLFVFVCVFRGSKNFSSSILLIHVHFKFQATPRLKRRLRERQ